MIPVDDTTCFKSHCASKHTFNQSGAPRGRTFKTMALVYVNAISHERIYN